MANESSSPDLRIKGQRGLTDKREDESKRAESTKERCNIVLHKEMERRWEERETENQLLKDKLRRMEEEEAEQAQEAAQSLLERCKNKVKKEREKRTQLVERARTMIQEETNRRTELEEELGKMKEGQLEKLQQIKRKIEMRLRKNMEEEFEGRLQEAIQEIERKKNAEIEWFKAICREEQNLKDCDLQLRQTGIMKAGREHQQQFEMLKWQKANERMRTQSLTELQVQGDQATSEPWGLIVCKPRPQADLTPQSWLQTQTDQAPEPNQDSEPEMAAKAQCIVMDIEFDDNEWIDVDVVYKGRIVPSLESEEAKQRLLKEAEEAEQKAQAEEAEQKAQAEAFEIERQKIIAELKKNHKQFLVDEDEARKEEEEEEEEEQEGSDCSSLQTETSDEEEKDFQDEAEKKAFIKNSKCRRAVYWLNKIIRQNHETKIKKTFVNEEKKGDQLVIKGNLDTGMTCAMFEQIKRSKLLRAMEERKKVEEEWLRSQREKSQKKQAKRQQKMEKSNAQPYPKQSARQKLFP